MRLISCYIIHLMWMLEANEACIILHLTDINALGYSLPCILCHNFEQVSLGIDSGEGGRASRFPCTWVCVYTIQGAASYPGGAYLGRRYFSCTWVYLCTIQGASMRNLWGRRKKLKAVVSNCRAVCFCNVTCGCFCRVPWNNVNFWKLLEGNKN